MGEYLKIGISYFVGSMNGMELHFPAHEPRLRQLEKGPETWDPYRKKWVAFTPEEWVRQNLLHYLVLECKVPPKWIAIEKSLKIGKLTKRTDVLVYKDNQPWLLAECKAQQVPLSPAVLQQILAYHSVTQAPYLVISNGQHTYCFAAREGRWENQDQLPQYG